MTLGEKIFAEVKALGLSDDQLDVAAKVLEIVAKHLIADIRRQREDADDDRS